MKTKTPHPERVILIISRSEIADPIEAEKAAIAIYQQASRRTPRIVGRVSDETEHRFHVEVAANTESSGA